MSDNFNYVNFDTLFNQGAYPASFATQQPDPGQVNAADEPVWGDDSLFDWSFYADTQGTYSGPGQVANAHIEGPNLNTAGLFASQAPSSLTPFAGCPEIQPGCSSFIGPGSQYALFGFDGTLASANRLAFPNNTNTFDTGTALGLPYAPSLPDIGAGTGFGTLDTRSAPLIGQEQETPDESTLLQLHAGFDATADR